MVKLEFFDPSMCCSTGICGPSVDEALIRVNEDISKLKETYPEILIDRYMITQQPLKFRNYEEVYNLVKEKGNDVLPITTINGRVIKIGKYPTLVEIVAEIEGEK